jgi:hypothetical protein
MAVPLYPMTLEDRQARQAGPIVDGWQIAQSVGTCLFQRLIGWLDETARQQGDPKPVQRPKWIGVLRGEDGMPEEQIPRVMVACSGTTRTPDRRSDGEVYPWWDVQVAALCDDTDPGMAYRLASIYGAAIAACVDNHAVDHSDVIDTVEWVGGTSTVLLPTGGLTTQRFEVLAGPAFSTHGRLVTTPWPQPDGDDQGNQSVVVNTNLELHAHPPTSGQS